MTFLAKVGDLFSQALDGKNLEAFMTELATGVKTALLEHFKKFQVSATGGIMVTKDISQYITTLRGLPVSSAFISSLDVLSEIGNLFVIGPDALRDRLRGLSGHPGLEKADVRPYVLRREDAGSVGVQSVLNGM